MLNFNSSSLRYKFIYLTKNIYDGIAIHTLFEDALHESGLKMELNEDIPFHLIDKYINFIPFSLRFNVTYKQRDRVLENDITLSAKGEEIKRMSFNHILFLWTCINQNIPHFCRSKDCKTSTRPESA